MELEDLICLSAASLARPSKNRDFLSVEDLKDAVRLAHILWRETLKHAKLPEEEQ